MFGIVMCLSIFIILAVCAENNRRKTKEMLKEEMAETVDNMVKETDKMKDSLEILKENVNKKSDDIISSCEKAIDSIDNNK